MATATIIDGKQFAARLRAGIATQVAQLKAEQGVTPGLTVVLVGEDPASQIYVRNKGLQAREAGMNSFEHRLPATCILSDAGVLPGTADQVRGKAMTILQPAYIQVESLASPGLHCDV